jgi:hypothetical protein
MLKMVRNAYPTGLNHRDVVVAIAPGNLAAFPPSLEVNADFAWSKNLSMQVVCVLRVESLKQNTFTV